MEDILDEEQPNTPAPPPWWPSVVMGGLAGAALLMVFRLITYNGGTNVIIHLIVVFIVLNSTLNHYRAKVYSNQSNVTAFTVCFATYLLMMFTCNAIMLLWFKQGSYDFSLSIANPLNSVVMLVLGGLVISAISAALSKRYKQP